MDSIAILTLCLEKLDFQSIKRTMQMFSLTKFYILLEASNFFFVSAEVKNPIHVRQRISRTNESVSLQSLNFNRLGIDTMADKSRCVVSFNTTVR